MPLIRRARIAALLPLLVACAERSATDAVVDAVADLGTAGPKPRRLDLLVITDVVANFDYCFSQSAGVQKLVAELAQPTEGPAVTDWRVGATFAFVKAPELVALCGSAAYVAEDGGDLIAPVEPPRSRFVDSATGPKAVLTQARSAMVMADCALPAYLEAARRALDGRNNDFVREDSLLVILFITAGEDCSTKNSHYWDQSTWPPDVRAHVLCREPHNADLLYSVEHYVNFFKQAHPRGALLLAVIGASFPPEFGDDGAGRRTVIPVCNGQVLPTDRLRIFTEQINALGSPRRRASFFDGFCAAATQGDYAAYLRNVPLIREMMDLSLPGSG